MGETARAAILVEYGTPVEILTAVHAGMKHTRGGAVSVARYDEGELLVFAELRIEHGVER